MREQQQTRRHGEDGCDLDRSCQILQVSALTRASHIDHRDDADHQKRYDLGRPGLQFNQSAQIIAERDRQRGHGSGADDEEENPAKEEARETSKTVANVDVKAPGLGLRGAEFAVGESSQERQKSADDPNHQGHRN